MTKDKELRDEAKATRKEVLEERARCIGIIKAFPTARPTTLIRKIKEGDVPDEKLIKRNAKKLS